ncbi:hypothetical protein T10_8900 [Trichinella papuae]|uniref:Uncharacterized protein n=1 Tax=Trichinella papuae TaxID=268474 RepID=A0A0V1MAS5_9BILA|nr:hypothetical protein T10_8900 [Trichinella papuae]
MIVNKDQITLRNFIEFYNGLISNYSGQCLVNGLLWLKLANCDMLAHVKLLRVFISDVYQIVIHEPSACCNIKITMHYLTSHY